jgi:hypothetical protein
VATQHLPDSPLQCLQKKRAAAAAKPAKMIAVGDASATTVREEKEKEKEFVK